MKTILRKVKEGSDVCNGYEEAAKVLKNGGLVAFPTETVYGLGGDGLSQEVAKKIYEAKGRPSDNPLIIHIAKIESLYELVKDVPIKAKKLAEKFWPGPLTIIFHKNNRVPYETTGGLETVAVRMPGNLVALELIRKSGVYIAAPSANTSGRPSPTTAQHVMDDLEGKIDMVLDGGGVEIGLESTIVDMTTEIPVILRPGYITIEMITDIIGEVKVDKAILSNGVREGLKPKAPGMKYKHYAPKGELVLYKGNPNDVVKAINEAVIVKKACGKITGVLAVSEEEKQYQADYVKCIGSRMDVNSIARNLYRVLREFDDMGVEYIFGECFSNENFGQAVMNRMLKAAGYQVIHVSETEGSD